jgi:hypothetical protein
MSRMRIAGCALSVVLGLSVTLGGCGAENKTEDTSSAAAVEESVDTAEEATTPSAEGSWVDGAFTEGKPAGAHFTISSVMAQATTESDPAKLVIRGTIENDTTLEAAATDLPHLTMDGNEVACTYYLMGKEVDKVPGATAEAPTAIDFESVSDLDTTNPHTWQFVAVDGTEVDGLDQADLINAYVADFTV